MFDVVEAIGGGGGASAGGGGGGNSDGGWKFIPMIELLLVVPLKWLRYKMKPYESTLNMTTLVFKSRN